MKQLKYILVTILITFMSCQSTKFHKKDFVGKYKYKTNKLSYNFDYKLELNADTTFYLQISNQSCIGKWRFLSKNKVMLKCDDVDTMDALSSGYLSQREYTIKLLNDNNFELTIYNPYLPSIPLLNQPGKKEKVPLKRGN
ncbi:hypothetical protein IR148_15915 [Dysgonomonas mossii]|uniref:Lipocalin-like domain-containing protein n=1 Tax=Dysgonomonas mossii TaxID=163665 RepID=A0A4Y9II21_9BACT|nr:hypothetical protein [Dysgonomonas mossii]MBF0762528.1 hypothetical protein [Dysgonomonas mossii]TFU86933.1 hypothetical protein E4T88_15890 [Dysgonomonas mossii]